MNGLARVLAVSVGLVGVIAVLFSALRTVVVPRQEQERITRIVLRWTHYVFRFGASLTNSSSAADAVLARSAPAGLVLLPGAWAAGVIVSFVPIYWGLDDFPYFEYIPPKGGGLGAPSVALEVWRGDFDWANKNVPHGVFPLTMHPQVIGRGHRMTMLEGLMLHMQEAGVGFSTITGAADAFRSNN